MEKKMTKVSGSDELSKARKTKVGEEVQSLMGKNTQGEFLSLPLDLDTTSSTPPLTLVDENGVTKVVSSTQGSEETVVDLIGAITGSSTPSKKNSLGQNVITIDTTWGADGENPNETTNKNFDSLSGTISVNNNFVNATTKFQENNQRDLDEDGTPNFFRETTLLETADEAQSSQNLIQKTFSSSDSVSYNIPGDSAEEIQNSVQIMNDSPNKSIVYKNTQTGHTQTVVVWAQIDPTDPTRGLLKYRLEWDGIWGDAQDVASGNFYYPIDEPGAPNSLEMTLLDSGRAVLVWDANSNSDNNRLVFNEIDLGSNSLPVFSGTTRIRPGGGGNIPSSDYIRTLRVVSKGEYFAVSFDYLNSSQNTGRLYAGIVDTGAPQVELPEIAANLDVGDFGERHFLEFVGDINDKVQLSIGYNAYDGSINHTFTSDYSGGVGGSWNTPTQLSGSIDNPTKIGFAMGENKEYGIALFDNENDFYFRVFSGFTGAWGSPVEFSGNLSSSSTLFDFQVRGNKAFLSFRDGSTIQTYVGKYSVFFLDQEQFLDPIIYTDLSFGIFGDVENTYLQLDDNGVGSILWLQLDSTLNQSKMYVKSVRINDGYHIGEVHLIPNTAVTFYQGQSYGITMPSIFLNGDEAVFSMLVNSPVIGVGAFQVQLFRGYLGEDNLTIEADALDCKNKRLNNISFGVNGNDAPSLDQVKFLISEAVGPLQAELEALKKKTKKNHEKKS